MMRPQDIFGQKVGLNLLKSFAALLLLAVLFLILQKMDFVEVRTQFYFEKPKRGLCIKCLIPVNSSIQVSTFFQYVQGQICVFLLVTDSLQTSYNKN